MNNISKPITKPAYQDVDLEIEFLEEEVVSQKNFSDTDIIFINESDDLIKVCELILMIRKKSDAVLWLVAQGTIVERQSIYMELGVDGIMETRNSIDEMILTTVNLIKRLEQLIQKKSNDSFYPSKQLLETRYQLIPNKSVLLIDGEKEINLTRREYQLFDLLSSSKEKMLTYEEISKNMWGETKEDKQYRISNLVFHLREKFKKGDLDPAIIKTVRSKGYTLNY
jgi:two-component system response regulator VicR